ncbi:probable carboxylesterase Os04g0669500 [Pistacia vera]|uniref:probable carboxylesterase Os04g0669500 n=1 Tax=Pistacia vera TaxID=55513 RepID=UPI0012631CF2|nr:probable carboxylesterase Os04g0669500 [Pistacia vera]
MNCCTTLPVNSPGKTPTKPSAFSMSSSIGSAVCPSSLFSLNHQLEFFVYDPQNSPKDELGVLKAVQNVHAMIDKEVATGTDPKNVFVCGFSQRGALMLASVLLYPKTLGGGVGFSGWIPFNSSLIEKQYCSVSRSMRPQLLVVIAFRRASIKKKKKSSEVCGRWPRQGERRECD